MSDAADEITQGLASLGERFRADFASAANETALREARAQVLGKKGDLTALLKLMGKVPKEKKKDIGAAVNKVKGEVEEVFNARLTVLAEAERRADLNARPYDLTLPARSPNPSGHLHPLTRAKYDILDIFRSLGFEVGWGPEIELEDNNFTKLAFPPDHPATDMQYTSWGRVDGAARARTLLRTHTTSVQVRELLTRNPPLAVVSAGAVYRRDDDVTHSPMFHQVDGFMVGEDVSFAQLKGVLSAFARRLYGADAPVRFRASYFPFVEPGAELDIGCVFCEPGEARAKCRVCKSTGWLEVLGCGMVHPAVLEHCGIDSEKYTGFAFGLGIDRVAMLRYAIPDIRVLFDNDPRFLAQF